MDYKLQVFKHEAREGWTYRLAVVNKAKSYPANFVCMLPIKLVKSKESTGYGGIFGNFFGDKSLDVALQLLNEALKTEHEPEIVAEIEKRLKLIDPKLVNVVRCNQCKKTFQPKKVKRYKQYLCDKCLNLQRSQKRY